MLSGACDRGGWEASDRRALICLHFLRHGHCMECKPLQTIGAHMPPRHSFAGNYALLLSLLYKLVAGAGQVKSCACRVPVSCLSHGVVSWSWHRGMDNTNLIGIMRLAQASRLTLLFYKTVRTSLLARPTKSRLEPGGSAVAVSALRP